MLSSLTPYVAISHVWADGLGNPASNGLPRCQLDKLFALLGDLINPSTFASIRFKKSSTIQRALWNRTSRRYFWMDTFCIPVGTTVSPTIPGLVALPMVSNESTQRENNQSLKRMSRMSRGRIQSPTCPTEEVSEAGR
jgi:hypothetical protein